MFTVAASDFSLSDCLTSGQTFRWRELDGWWYGFVGPAVVRVRQQDGGLLAESSEAAAGAEQFRRYFGLDHDLGAILRTIDVDAQVHEAIARRRGLRVLRQDGWETLASFICASFNNIRRIEGMIERLCQAYGRPVALNGFRGFAFPSAEALANASERRLRALGLGYRAPYLRATARRVAEGRLPLAHVERLDYDAARRALLGCDGVGEKVADCVALFGFAKHDAFPVDVWVERVMRYYFRHRRPTPKRVRDYARRHFGPWAGWAQQYLYHDIRMRHAADRN